MPYDGEEFQLAVALGAGAGGQHHEGLGAVVGEEDLPVDLDAAELGMDDRLALVVALGDLLELPCADELGAVLLEFGEDAGGPGVSLPADSATRRRAAWVRLWCSWSSSG